MGDSGPTSSSVHCRGACAVERLEVGLGEEALTLGNDLVPVVRVEHVAGVGLLPVELVVRVHQLVAQHGVGHVEALPTGGARREANEPLTVRVERALLAGREPRVGRLALRKAVARHPLDGGDARGRLAVELDPGDVDRLVLPRELRVGGVLVSAPLDVAAAGGEEEGEEDREDWGCASHEGLLVGQRITVAT